MPNIDPHLMGVFRSKIKNPACLWNTYRIMRSYCAEELATTTGAYGAVDQLSGALGVPVTTEQRENAARWLMQCKVNPHIREHRYAMWNMINRY
jgi:hypothetical protein